MKSMSFKFRHSTLLAAGFSLALSACGASQDAIGQSEQPISSDGSSDEGYGDTGSSDPAGPEACAGGLLMSESSSAAECQVTARGLCFATNEAACACAGCELEQCAIAETFPGQAFCQSDDVHPNPDGSVSDGDAPSGGGSDGYPGDGTTGGTGCGSSGSVDPTPSDACAAGAERDVSGQTACNFVVDALCFDTAAAACSCAGCATHECLILESYPAQIRCQ